MATLRHVRLLSLTSKLILRDSPNLNATFTESLFRRCLHIASRQHPQSSSIFNTTPSSKLHVFRRIQAPTWSVCGVQRHQSTEPSTSTPELLPDMEQVNFIPDPPSLPSYMDVSELPLNALGEPTLQSLGLGSGWPAGLYQQSLEFLHIEGLSWIGAIALVTVAMRLAMLPLNVLVQRNAAATQNAAPQIKAINDKILRASQGGNQLLMMKHNEELKDFMKAENVHPLKNFAVMFAQAPIFMTVFTGLRGMTNLPLDSMAAEAMWWISDITVPDPFFILPMLTAGTLLLTLELGAETGVQLDEQSKMIRKVVRVLPFITLVLIAKFPAALCFYWFTSNICSLVMVLFFKIQPVRTFFKIPRRNVIPVDEHPADPAPSTRGFLETFRGGIKMSEKAHEYELRKRVGAVTLKDNSTISKKDMSTSASKATSRTSASETASRIKQVKEKGK